MHEKKNTKLANQHICDVHQVGRSACPISCLPKSGGSAIISLFHLDAAWPLPLTLHRHYSNQHRSRQTNEVQIGRIIKGDPRKASRNPGKLYIRRLVGSLRACVCLRFFLSVRPPAHSFACAFVCSFVRPLVRAFAHWFNHSRTPLRNNAFMHSCIHSFTHPSNHSCIHSFLHVLTHSFVCSFSRSGSCSSIRPRA